MSAEFHSLARSAEFKKDHKLFMSLRIVNVFTISRHYGTKDVKSTKRITYSLKKNTLVGVLSANSFHGPKLQ